MNKFHRYLSPVYILIASLGIAALMNNEFVLFTGWLVSLMWMYRVATGFQNRALKIIASILIIVTLVWGIGLLYWAAAW